MHADPHYAPNSPTQPHDNEAGEKKTSRTVTRYDIATAIMKRVPALSRREAQEIFECALQEIADALSKREEMVKLHEFGTFVIRRRTKRQEREALKAEGAPPTPRRSVNFRPSGALKEKVERGRAQARNRSS
jgi:nucleoid DNA-binding protein